MKLIVGLGNPGEEYREHRHNLGFRVVEALAARQRWRWQLGEAGALVAAGDIKGKPVLLAKPATWMNLSGRAVALLVRSLNVSLSELLIVHDDIDLALGKIRATDSSGHGGHNGIRSIIETLGSQDFPRLRLGVGRPPEGTDPADYVLQPFRSEEASQVEVLEEKAVTWILNRD